VTQIGHAGAYPALHALHVPDAPNAIKTRMRCTRRTELRYNGKIIIIAKYSLQKFLHNEEGLL
jgi:hypothetical protein